MIHSFLRSVGFRNIKKKSDLYKILEDIINNPDVQSIEEDNLVKISALPYAEIL